MFSETFKFYETSSNELNPCKRQLKELKDVDMSLNSWEFAYANLEKEKDELTSMIKHENEKKI